MRTEREATLTPAALRAGSPLSRSAERSEASEGVAHYPRRHISFPHRMQAWGAAVYFGVFGLLPLDWASAIGGALARATGPRLGISKRARLNIARALPQLSE